MKIIIQKLIVDKFHSPGEMLLLGDSGRNLLLK